MAGIQLVHSFEQVTNCTVSWSDDHRIAVGAGKDVIIMKVDMSHQNTHSKLQTTMVDKLKMSDFCPKHESPFSDLCSCLQLAPLEARSRFLINWTYHSFVSEDQVSTEWRRLAWSPSSVGNHKRSVLAGITCDHCLVIVGLNGQADNLGSKWTQLADLESQLWEQHRDDFQHDWSRLKGSKKDRLGTAGKNMSSICATELEWSSVFESVDADGKKDKFVFLFVAMKNGDIVTWLISLPFLGIQSCRLVGRQTAESDCIVTCLAWTPVASHKNTGMLAVGYADGRVELQWWPSAITSSLNSTVSRCTQFLHSQVDYMLVASLVWAECKKVGLVLVCTKEQITSAYTVDLGGNSNGAASEKSQVRVLGSCHTRLGNWLPVTGLKRVRDTILMASDDGSVRQICISGSPHNPEVQCLRKLPFEFDEPDWQCIGLSLSPNAYFCVAIFKPNFEYNLKASRFRYPVHMYMCPIPKADLPTLEQMLLSDKEYATSQFHTDILEFARCVVYKETTTKESAQDLLETFSTSPYTDTLLGSMVARYAVFTVCEICKSHDWTETTEAAEEAFSDLTERLLCRHIGKLWNKIQKHSVTASSDLNGSILNSMRRWIKELEERVEMVGSDIVEQLCALCGDSQPDSCPLCDTEFQLTGVTKVTCSNSHTFGVCCQTLSVCCSVAYLACSVCGALALPSATLTDVTWLEAESPILCTLCGSFMYSSHATYCI